MKSLIIFLVLFFVSLNVSAGKRDFEIVPAEGQKVSISNSVGYFVQENTETLLIIGYVPDSKKTGFIRVSLRNLTDSAIVLVPNTLVTSSGKTDLKLYTNTNASQDVTTALNRQKNVSELIEPPMKPFGKPVMTKPGDPNTLRRQVTAAQQEAAVGNRKLLDGARFRDKNVVSEFVGVAPEKLTVSSGQRIVRDFKIELPTASKGVKAEFVVQFNGAGQSIKLQFREIP